MLTTQIGRAMICGIFALVLVFSRGETETSEALRAAAERRGIFFGSAANYGVLQTSDADYRDILRKQYSLVTAENACKWEATEGQGPHEYNFQQCDYIKSFSVSSNQTFRGHNLCWNKYNPQWLVNSNFNRSELEDLLVDHVKSTVTHYNRTAYAWDVVNEAISDTNAILFKNGTWYPAVQNYVDIAFHAARKALPDGVKLFYNDYNVASSNGWSRGKSDKMYNMVQSMLARDVPIDGVGLQMHVDVDYSMADGVRSNIQRYGKIGIEVHITEMDVGCQAKGSCHHYDSSVERKQAEVFAAILSACLSEPNCKSFETCSLMALPFDANYKPKLAVQAMLDTMNGNFTWVQSYWRRVHAQRAFRREQGLSEIPMESDWTEYRGGHKWI